MVEKTENGSLVFTGDDIPIFRLMSLRSALQLEVRGIEFRMGGKSVCSIIKKEFGLKGNKEKVLIQFTEIVEQAKARRHI